MLWTNFPRCLLLSARYHINQFEGHIFSFELTPQEIPVPEFVSSKAENEWDEDEKKAYEDYEKKTVELDERKEAYKKVLRPHCFAVVLNIKT